MAEILVAASAEMADAAARFNERIVGFGERFFSDAERTFVRIEQALLTGPLWTHPRVPVGVRHMFLRSFPYAVVYVLERDLSLLRSPICVGGRVIGRNG